MSRPLRFTKTEMKNAAQVAVSENVSVNLNRDGSIQITPFADSSTKKEKSVNTLTEWLEEHGREA